MATGIPPKTKTVKRKIPVVVSYDGKVNVDEILESSYHTFEKLYDVNGTGENHFYCGDNKDALLYLLNNGYKGKVKLIYIDPPFATASNFVNRNQEYAYSDFLCGGEYVEFLRERLIIMRELLATDGSIYLHLDGKMAFTMKLIMDEIFGEENCRAFITRKKCSTKNYTKNTYGNISDYVMFYSKTEGIPVQDIWLDYRDSVNQSQKTTGYPTEKNYDMIKMIVNASSNPGDLVMDCFAGSSTTLGAAFELGRPWIGVDCGNESFKAILKRFISGLEAYGDYVSNNTYSQCTMNLLGKCPFDVWGDETTKDMIVKAMHEIEESNSNF